MEIKIIPRAWFYFRMGWSLYFAFIFAAINTLTVTYFLAIEKYPTLQAIFPSFLQYVILIAGIGIPILVVIGYFHIKKTSAFRSETAVAAENNPYQRRTIVNTELILQLNQELMKILLKNLKNEKITDKELEEIGKIESKIKDITTTRKFSNDIETKYLKEISENKY
jgi:hypothetical protein